MQGLINIDGVDYVEREHKFVDTATITSNGQVLIKRLVLPGIAPFWLKALTRVVIAANVVVTNRPFKFRWGTSDSSTYFSSGGNGSTNDRVVDTLTFGDGRFPHVIAPHVFLSKNSSLNYEVEDLSNNPSYDIHFAFIGCYLIPRS